MTYIFLTTSIMRTGGAQLYISRKVDHLMKLGWEVHVFSIRGNDSYIENLQKYKDEECKILDYRFVATHPIIRKKVLSFIKSKIKSDSSKIIIESHLFNLAIWGEYIAKKLNAINIYYDLDENHERLPEKGLDFIRFKYNQKCLYGITNKTIPLMGLNDETNQTLLIAVGGTSNVIEDVPFEIPECIANADFRILSFGNLGKHYITNMVDEIINFAQSHTEKSIGVILTGYTEGIAIQDNHKVRLDSIPNVNSMLVPMMLPFPIKLFDVADVCIACSGCAHLAKQIGMSTITVDNKDHQAIGVLHETTENVIYRTSEPQIKIADLLEEILIEKKYPKRKIEITTSQIDYTKHDELLNLNIQKEYYDLSKLMDLKNLISQQLNLLFGYETLTKKIYSCLKK